MENKNYDFNLDEDLKKDLFGDPVSSQVPAKESLMDDFLSEMSSQGASSDPLEDLAPKKETNEFSNDFKFERPLPPEPASSTLDFLQGETNDYFGIKNAERDSPSPVRDFDTPSPVPPQVPLHGYDKRTESPVKKRDESPPSRDDSPLFKGKESPLPPPTPERDSPEFRDDSPEPLPRTPEPELPKFKPVEEFKEPEEPKKPEPEKPKTTFVRKKSVEDIGAQDIRVKIDAWFNPARLHPAVESLVYWRDPKKSGVVFGVTMLTLISLTLYSLISVVAYLCLITVLGTVSFRIYKSIMQAVQKTSDGHPFKEILDIDLSIPEDKVKEVSLLLVQYINTSVASLRSLFLVEDIIDSIKFAVILWVLTYVGACFNGLTLIIIGVILLFSLPKVYENNKAQIDVYIKLGMDKLSIITNKVKTIVPESKKEEKAKDQ